MPELIFTINLSKQDSNNGKLLFQNQKDIFHVNFEREKTKIF